MLRSVITMASCTKINKFKIKWNKGFPLQIKKIN